MVATWPGEFSVDDRGEYTLDVHKGYLGDPEFIRMLDMGYTEGRYPTPIAKSIWSRQGFPALASDKTDKKAFAIGAAILAGITQKYGYGFSFDGLITSSSVTKEDCERFKRTWEMWKMENR